MKRFVPLILLSFAAGTAYAQTTTPAPAPATTAPAATPAPAAETPMPKKMSHHRMTLADKFAKANTTNDGKLTADQAKAGFPYVAKHFDAIDTGKKGYVTVDDIHAYAKSQHPAHHHKPAAAAAPAATTN